MNAARLAKMMTQIATYMEANPGLKIGVACDGYYDAKRMYDFLASEERACTYTVTYFDHAETLRVYQP